MFMRAVIVEEIKKWEVVPLFRDEAVSSHAWELLSKTLEYKGQSALTKERLAQFFEHMRKQPASEQFFLVVADSRTNPDDISYAVHKIRNFNLFCGFQDELENKRIIPSYGMVQALLDATGDDGFKIKPVIGISTEEGMLDSMKVDNAREICVHCPMTGPAPSEADGYFATPSTFIYHSWCCRHIPPGHRNLYISLAEYACNISQNSDSPKEKFLAKELYSYLLDMDFLYYQPNTDDHISDLDRIMITVIEKNVETYFSKIKVPIDFKSFKLIRLFETIFAIWFCNQSVNFDDIIRHFDTLDQDQKYTYYDRVFRDFPRFRSKVKKSEWQRGNEADFSIPVKPSQKKFVV